MLCEFVVSLVQNHNHVTRKLSQKSLDHSNTNIVPVGLLGLARNTMRVFESIAARIASRSNLSSPERMGASIRRAPAACTAIEYTMNERSLVTAFSPRASSVAASRLSNPVEPRRQQHLLRRDLVMRSNFWRNWLQSSSE